MAWEFILLAVLIQFPVVRETFGIRMPTGSDLAMALAVSAVVVFAIEMTKVFLRATTRGAVRKTVSVDRHGTAQGSLPETDRKASGHGTRPAVF
jgi:hypothetical protein